MNALVNGRGRSNSAPADLTSLAEPRQPSRESQETSEERHRAAAYRQVAADAAAEGGRRPGVLEERRRRVGAVAADAAAEGRRREEEAGERGRVAAVAADAAAEGGRRPGVLEERRRRVGAVAADAAAEGRRREEEAGERGRVAAVAADAAAEGRRRPGMLEERRRQVGAVAMDAAAEGHRRQEAAAEQRRQDEEAAAEEQRRQEAQEAAAAAATAAAQDRLEPDQVKPDQLQPDPGQPEVRRRRRGLRRLADAGGQLRRVAGKMRQLLTTSSKTDKAKKILDPPDTVANRINAPTEGGVRTQAQATGDTGQVEATAIVAQVDTGINAVTDVLGVVNDARALNTARKGRKGVGPESHKPRKDMNGKPLGVVQNVGMVAGDATGMANAAVRNAGHLGGVSALGEATGVFSVFYSTVIAARDSTVLWKTYNKNRALKGLVQGPSGEASGNEGQLQDVHDRLGEVQRRTAGAGAAREQEGGESDVVAADVGTAAAELGAGVLEVNQLLHAELAQIIQYARHKQHTKMGKRIASLGGNTVRTAGGGLAIAAAAGAIAGPAAPAVAGAAAALLLSGALYKGARAGSNRYVAARHPDRWARPTPAQAEAGTDRPEAAASASAPEPAERRDALKEFFKVTKSVQQGERHHMAQKLYALAAGPDVPASRNAPDGVRESARALLGVLKAGPSQHRKTPEEWAASLNDPAQQGAWEKEIANQLSSA
ncbi:hypothetical protein MUK60_38035 [Streptomyces sp. LRE541]|uniref:hypothetical protein n=1 Tax=Streptomyces sp. LRE541 TaxID=2931983 RepID=UPI00200D39E5|nr:hypothetical protein [Streptomyces sp. LRE541]UPZ33085.1 hypothetical protein MUK60_38035 [Streptomyces sp. LRE541]